MASRKAISVQLSGRQQAMLRRQLDSGRYESASEVIGDALRTLDRRELMFDEWLRNDVRASMADKRRSTPIDKTFERIRGKIARKSRDS